MPSNRPIPIGIRAAYTAIATESADGKIIYGVPKKMADSITMTLKYVANNGSLAASDIIVSSYRMNASIDVTYAIDSLDIETRAALAGHKVDANGGMIVGADDRPPNIALGFWFPLDNAKFGFAWLYYGQFGDPDETLQTKGDDGKITYSTPTMTGKFIPRVDTRVLRYYIEGTEEMAETFFESVVEPEPITGG